MNLNLKGELRNRKGTGGSHAIRRESKIPCVIYGRDEETVLAKVDEPEFRRIEKEAGASTIIGLKVDGSEIPVIIKEIQKDPIKDLYLHVDFQKVSMNEKIRVTIPIFIENRDSIRVQPSTLSQQLDEIEIECLPRFLPEGDILVDVASMEIGDSITVADLDIAKVSEITILRELDDVVCSLSAFVEEVEEDVEVDLEAEPELVSNEKED